MNIILQLTKNLCTVQCTYRTSFNRGPNTNALYILYIFQPTTWRSSKKKEDAPCWYEKKKNRNSEIFSTYTYIYICINRTTLKTVRAMLIWVPSKFAYHIWEELRKNSKAEQSIFTERYENLFWIETWRYGHSYKTYLHTYMPARFHIQMKNTNRKKNGKST